MFRLDGKRRFPGRGANGRCVEMVGCCSFSNSRSFAARFLQIMLHKQVWLTWYLRKLNNSQAHGSLRRVRAVCCVIVLPGSLVWFWFCFGARLSSSVCHSGKYSGQFHISAPSVINGVFVTVGNVVMWWLQRSGRWCHPVRCCASRVSERLLLCF